MSTDTITHLTDFLAWALVIHIYMATVRWRIEAAAHRVSSAIHASAAKVLDQRTLHRQAAVEYARHRRRCGWFD